MKRIPKIFALLLALIPGLLVGEEAFRPPPGVVFQPDVVYASVGSRQLHLDLYLPAAGAGPFPAVVYIHGGGWSGGDRTAFQRQACHMATVGFVGACIEYRLSTEAHYPAALFDAKAAVRWVRANAAKYRIDPDRIGAAGGSAGGELAALLGTTIDEADFEGEEGVVGVSSRVRAVAAFNPALDLVDLATRPQAEAGKGAQQFLGASYQADPQLWRSASPAYHAGQRSVPFLFLHGDADPAVPYYQSVRMMQKLRDAGVWAELFTAPGARHAFFNRPPWYEPTLERMERFFRETLGSASGALPESSAQAPRPTGIELSPERAAPTAVTLDGREISLPGEGGFRLYDAAAKQAVEIAGGVVKEGAAFDWTGTDLHLHAEFVPQHGYVLVRGSVENLRGGERGLILDYRIPLLSAGAVFSNQLDQATPMTGAREREGNAFPIASMTDAAAGVALAIPPSDPRDFGMVADARSMSIRFYLGLSPKPRRFPNRASFVFMIYGIDPAWGFRSALDRYYGFFPDYYVPAMRKAGLFMYQMEDRVPANVGQYGFDTVEMQWSERTLGAALNRDRMEGITTFPYTLVGQREIKFLPAYPADYAAAMAVFDRWSVASQSGHPLTKENVTSEGDLHLKEEVEASACWNSEDRNILLLRETRWGGKSITFKMNPNPDLFADQPRHTVGGDQLELADRWIREHPGFGGIYVDSLGANWPAAFNYRQDHFAYARYPLTIDPKGRAALQNTTSHYEFLETLRRKLRQDGRLTIGNGIYTYVSRGNGARPGRMEQQKFDRRANEFIKGAGPPEHYRGAGTKLGRFFIAALLDAATCEQGIKATVAGCQDNRVMMGRKPYAYINYDWEDRGEVEELVNKCLSYGIYASSTTNDQTGVQYENHPKGYLRDRELLDWYVPLVRLLSQAGWEPVRHAAIEGSEVTGERFGHGQAVYFTLYNDSDSKETGTLAVDLAALGFAGDNAAFAEIAHNRPLAPRGAGRVGLEMEPKRAYVVRLSRVLR